MELEIGVPLMAGDVTFEVTSRLIEEDPVGHANGTHRCEHVACAAADPTIC